MASVSILSARWNSSTNFEVQTCLVHPALTICWPMMPASVIKTRRDASARQALEPADAPVGPARCERSSGGSGVLNEGRVERCDRGSHEGQTMGATGADVCVCEEVYYFSRVLDRGSQKDGAGGIGVLAGGRCEPRAPQRATPSGPRFGRCSGAISRSTEGAHELTPVFPRPGTCMACFTYSRHQQHR